MDDPRIVWLAKNIAAHCKNGAADTQCIHEMLLSSQNSAAVTTFLDSAALTLLALITYSSEDVDLLLTTDANVPIPSNGAGLAFTKSSPNALSSPDEMENAVISCSMTSNVAACLFRILRNVYTPMLSCGIQAVGSNTRTLLSNLDAALTSEAFKHSDLLGSSEVLAILKPLDEVRRSIFSLTIALISPMWSWRL